MSTDQVSTDVVWLVVDETVLHPEGYRMMGFHDEEEALGYLAELNAIEDGCFCIQVALPEPCVFTDGSLGGWIMPEETEALRGPTEHLSIGDDDG